MFTHCHELYKLPALWRNQLFVIRHSTESVDLQFCPYTSNTYTVQYARKQRTCNSVTPSDYFVPYTFTSVFYLFNEHFVMFCKFNVNVWVFNNLWNNIGSSCEWAIYILHSEPASTHTNTSLGILTSRITRDQEFL